MGADRDLELIRFLNGNLCYVDVEDAMLVNFDTWETDWDTVLLTEEEKLLVHDDSWRRGLVFCSY